MLFSMWRQSREVRGLGVPVCAQEELARDGRAFTVGAHVLTIGLRQQVKKRSGVGPPLRRSGQCEIRVPQRIGVTDYPGEFTHQRSERNRVPLCQLETSAPDAISQLVQSPLWIGVLPHFVYKAQKQIRSVPETIAQLDKPAVTRLTHTVFSEQLQHQLASQADLVGRLQ
jgi:hypothetical protein